MKSEETKPQLYFAPMEGITGHIFRRAFCKHFFAPDKLFTPFIVPDSNIILRTRERNDIMPEHNRGLTIIPQILTNNSIAFVETAKLLAAYGYTEVNLNLGCPSGTVSAKRKGAGFLAVPEALDAFLEEIFRECPIEISIKTRIGIEREEEFEPLLHIYEKYPVKELTIHPRLLKDYYKNSPHRKQFESAYGQSKHRLCYNGDINSRKDYETLFSAFPRLSAVMIGRGALMNPWLFGEIRGAAGSPEKGKTLLAFQNTLIREYSAILSGERDVLFKLKELWFYLCKGSKKPEEYTKCVKKVKRLSELLCFSERFAAEEYGNIRPE